MELDPNFTSEKEGYLIGFSSMKNQLMKPLTVGSTTLFICSSGWAIVLLYNKKQLLRKGDILLANWDMHPIFVKVSNDFSSFYCMMSETIFYDVFRNISNSFCHFTYNYPVLRPTHEQAKQLINWLQQLLWLEKNIAEKTAKRALITSYLQNLMLVIDTEIQKASQIHSMTVMPRQLEILRAFGSLLHTYVTKNHDVAFYANQLAISPYYLSTITSKVMQETPKNLIDKQLIYEMKKRIITNVPLKKIADQLHFEDTSYMSRFFKRHTGLTPTAFRDSNTSF